MTTIYQVDAFTKEPFKGNPAGVCILDSPRNDSWMQQVAAEMNLSETAFLEARPNGGYNLRWFTPKAEVRLCGHATLASAHTLWETGAVLPGQTIQFFTLSGVLSAEQAGDWITLNFPVKYVEPTPEPETLVEGLGIHPIFVGRSPTVYLVEAESETAVREAQPDFALLKKLDVKGVIITSQASTPGYDFVSRYFAPVIGVNEDPVTGSAHCYLASYWGKRLGKTSFLAYQASARGGNLKVSLAGERVLISGQAVTILRGELNPGLP